MYFPYWFCSTVKCWNQTQENRGVRQRRIGKLILMVPLMSGKRCVNSRPGSLRVLEMMQMDGPGFSLCAAPLELSGPGF